MKLFICLCQWLLVGFLFCVCGFASPSWAVGTRYEIVVDTNSGLANDNNAATCTVVEAFNMVYSSQTSTLGCVQTGVGTTPTVDVFHIKFDSALDGQTITLAPSTGLYMQNKSFHLGNPEARVTIAGGCQQATNSFNGCDVLNADQWSSPVDFLVTLENLVFKGGAYYGGVFLAGRPSTNSKVTVDNCEFFDHHSVYAQNAALAIHEFAQAEISDSSFHDNRYQHDSGFFDSSGSAGLAFSTVPNILLTRVSIYNNEADSNGGAGMYIYNPEQVRMDHVFVSNNVLSQNSSPSYIGPTIGAGILIEDISIPSVTTGIEILNSTIVQNRNDGYGGGLAILISHNAQNTQSAQLNLDFYNSILSDNHAGLNAIVLKPINSNFPLNFHDSVDSPFNCPLLKPNCKGDDILLIDLDRTLQTPSGPVSISATTQVRSLGDGRNYYGEDVTFANAAKDIHGSLSNPSGLIFGTPINNRYQPLTGGVHGDMGYYDLDVNSATPGKILDRGSQDVLDASANLMLGYPTALIDGLSEVRPIAILSLGSGYDYTDIGHKEFASYPLHETDGPSDNVQTNPPLKEAAKFIIQDSGISPNPYRAGYDIEIKLLYSSEVTKQVKASDAVFYVQLINLAGQNVLVLPAYIKHSNQPNVVVVPATSIGDQLSVGAYHVLVHEKSTGSRTPAKKWVIQ